MCVLAVYMPCVYVCELNPRSHVKQQGTDVLCMVRERQRARHKVILLIAVERQQTPTEMKHRRKEIYF